VVYEKKIVKDCLPGFGVVSDSGLLFEEKKLNLFAPFNVSMHTSHCFFKWRL